MAIQLIQHSPFNPIRRANHNVWGVLSSHIGNVDAYAPGVARSPAPRSGFAVIKLYSKVPGQLESIRSAWCASLRVSVHWWTHRRVGQLDSPNCAPMVDYSRIRYGGDQDFASALQLWAHHR